MVPGLSRVIIRPDGDISGDSIAGKISNFTHQYNALAITGVVVALADGYPYVIPEDVRNSVDRDVQESIGLRQNVPCEIKVGDRVMFNYTANLEEEAYSFGHIDGCYSLHYSDLWARIDGGQLYPLNGQVLIIAAGPARSKDDRDRDWVVIAEGARVYQYSDGPETDMFFPPLVGKTVLIDTAFPIALETPILAKYSVDGERVHVVHRKHICAWRRRKDSSRKPLAWIKSWLKSSLPRWQTL